MTRANTWTSEQLDLLRKEYPFAKDTRDLAKNIGKSYSAIRSKSKLLKLKRQVPNSGHSDATPTELAYITKYYLSLPIKVIGSDINRSYTFVKGRMDDLGLVRPPELIDKVKAATYIKSGNIPLNKGKKQHEYMSRAAIARTKKTRFKKGRLPHNTKSDFEISIRADKRGVNYKHIRISLGKWIPLHRYNYIKEFGRIPPKAKIIFKDGDTMNCDVKNLEALTPADLMKRNSYHNYPKPIGEIIQLRGALTRQINKHLKKLKHEK